MPIQNMGVVYELQNPIVNEVSGSKQESVNLGRTR